MAAAGRALATPLSAPFLGGSELKYRLRPLPFKAESSVRACKATHSDPAWFLLLRGSLLRAALPAKHLLKGRTLAPKGMLQKLPVLAG